MYNSTSLRVVVKYPDGKRLLIDPVDADLLKHQWTLSGSVKRPYAHRYLRKHEVLDYNYLKRVSVYLHRVIGERNESRKSESWEVIDHINGNTLDCRRSNLRITTHSVNVRNNKSRREGKPIGIYLIKVTGHYRVTLCIDSRQINLGSYKTHDEAIQVYRVAYAQYIKTS